MKPKILLFGDISAYKARKLKNFFALMGVDYDEAPTVVEFNDLITKHPKGYALHLLRQGLHVTASPQALILQESLGSLPVSISSVSGEHFYFSTMLLIDSYFSLLATRALVFDRRLKLVELVTWGSFFKLVLQTDLKKELLGFGLDKTYPSLDQACQDMASLKLQDITLFSDGAVSGLKFTTASMPIHTLIRNKCAFTHIQKQGKNWEVICIWKAPKRVVLEEDKDDDNESSDAQEIFICNKDFP